MKMIKLCIDNNLRLENHGIKNISILAAKLKLEVTHQCICQL